MSANSFSSFIYNVFWWCVVFAVFGPSGLLRFIPRANTMKVKSSRTLSYKCASDCPFHGFAERLDNIESRNEFGAPITALIRLILDASYKQKMTPCIVEAIHESIEACKRTRVPIGPVVEFYEFRVGGKILPAWIILHSPHSDDQSKTSIRHLLLQTYLDDLPLTPTIRDELYLACAKTGYNNFFSRVRLASLKRLQARPETHATHTEIVHRLIPPPYPAETMTVVHTKPGFKLNWFVPDMFQRLQSGLTIGREFVAKGQVWGLYIRTQRGQLGLLGWDVVLCMLKPSRINLEKDIIASFNISLDEKRKFFSRRWIRFMLYSDHIETSDLPVEGDMPRTRALWLLSSSTADRCHQYINKSGSCYLMLDLELNSRGTGVYGGPSTVSLCLAGALYDWVLTLLCQ